MLSIHLHIVTKILWIIDLTLFLLEAIGVSTLVIAIMDCHDNA